MEKSKFDSDQHPSSFFDRDDESNDQSFYAEPRFVTHVDDKAINAIKQYLSQVLPKHGTILDLMSSWRSHLPDDYRNNQTIGLGLNDQEMRDNPDLDEWVIHDLNQNPKLPFKSEQFNAAILTVSIQYVTHPIEIFRETNRVLELGSSFHIIYSNRMFPTKAVAIWKSLDMTERASLIASYFSKSGSWTPPKAWDFTQRDQNPTDPVNIVSASKIDSSTAASSPIVEREAKNG